VIRQQSGGDRQLEIPSCNLVNMPLAAGTKLGDYDVVEMIGVVGMGEVLKRFTSRITTM
jgi:hypothetical protein